MPFISLSKLFFNNNIRLARSIASSLEFIFSLKPLGRLCINVFLVICFTLLSF